MLSVGQVSIGTKAPPDLDQPLLVAVVLTALACVADCAGLGIFFDTYDNSGSVHALPVCLCGVRCT